MNKSLLHRGLALICLLAFWLLGMHGLGQPALTSDEAVVALLAERPVVDILHTLNTDEPHPPGYYLTMHIWRVLIASNHELFVRLPSMYFAMLALCLGYALARTLKFGAWGALAVLLALALNPQLMVHYREARMYPLMLVSVALAAWASASFVRQPKPLAAGLVTLANGVALFSHYFNVLFIGALGLWGVFAVQGKARWQWIIAHGAAAGVLAVWLPFFGRGFFNPTSLNEGKVWSFLLPPWETLLRLAQTAAFGYRDIPDGALATIGAAMFVGVWLWGTMSERRIRLMLIVLVITPTLAFALIGAVRPIFHAKYMTPWVLFAVLGLGALFAQWWRWGIVGSALLLAVSGTAAWNTWRVPYDPGINVGRGAFLGTEARDLAQALQNQMHPRDVFAMRTPDAVSCFYTQRYFARDLGCVLIPQSPSQTVSALSGQLNALMVNREILWVLAFYNPGWDPNQILDAALNQDWLLLDQRLLANKDVALYTPVNYLQASQQTVNVQYAEAVELRGVWQATRGQMLYVALNWHALKSPPVGKVFIHLTDETGFVLSQQDGVPRRGTRPTNTWQTDETLWDVYALELPSAIDPQTLQIRIGLYDPQTVKRWEALDSKLQVRLPDDALVLSWQP